MRNFVSPLLRESRRASILTRPLDYRAKLKQGGILLMATNHTEYYELNQWLSTDQVLRTDFNADNAKMDAALSEMTANIPKIVMGTYTGDGTESRTISLPFTPKAVFVCTQWGETGFSEPGHYCGYGGLALDGYPARISYTATGTTTVTEFISITETGFQVVCLEARGANAYSNYLNEVYHYIAIG